MPSLAGPKSRAHLASFARLDDGAFCRVISASFKLWAPPTYASREEQSCTQTSGAAGAWYGQLAPALPLAARVPFFSPHHHTEHLFPPIVLDTGTRTHGLLRYALRAGVLVRLISHHATADLAGAVVERPKRNLARRRSTPQARALPISRHAPPKKPSCFPSA